MHFMALLISAQLFATTPDYQKQTAAQKQAELWEKITSSHYETLPAFPEMDWAGILRLLNSFGSLNVSFDRNSDFMPQGRAKVLHPFGSVAKVEFVPAEGTPYTGVLKGSIGLARLSLAGNPETLGYVPGMALKLLIDGRPSQNLQVMETLDGQGDNKNFFSQPFSNIIPEPETPGLILLKEYFGLWVENPLHLGLEHLGRYDRLGVKESQPKTPYRIVFVAPTMLANGEIPSDSKVDFRTSLAGLKENTLLYDVYAKDSADKIAYPFIGQVFMRSSFVASDFGDTKLFFRHHE